MPKPNPRVVAAALAIAAAGGQGNGRGVVPMGAQAEADIDATRVDAEALVCMNLPDPLYIACPWVSEGVTLIVGRPKIGKTTLLRQLAAAINNAGAFLTAPCDKAAVLFLSLEENERLMRQKLIRMGLPGGALAGIDMRFEWPQGPYGAERLRQWCERHAQGNPAVIIIDSLQRYRLPPDKQASAYTQDYEAVRLLAEVCRDFPGLAILALHHTTKATPDDPVAAISGTYGLSAAADDYRIVLPVGSRFRLHCGGRFWMGDASDYEIARADGAWHLVGLWDEQADSLPPRQREILAAIDGRALTPAAIGKRLGTTGSNVSHALDVLRAAGQVERERLDSSETVKPCSIHSLSSLSELSEYSEHSELNE